MLDRRPRDLLEVLASNTEAGDDAADPVNQESIARQLAHFLAPTTRAHSLGRLGQYEVLDVLGQGGHGIVVKGFDAGLHRDVAIKLLAPHLATTSPPRKRFLREAHAVAKVKHEHVLQIHAVEETPLPYLVMEYIAGETLQQRLDGTGPLDPADVVRLGQLIALGLAAAHDQGLIHRDVKPASILIEAGPEPRVKLTDFRLARTVDDASLTQIGVISGTPLYMAPEQAHGAPFDHRADLFSFGSVLYAMVSGRPPFRASNTLAVLKRVAEERPRRAGRRGARIAAGAACLLLIVGAAWLATRPAIAPSGPAPGARRHRPGPRNAPPEPTLSHADKLAGSIAELSPEEQKEVVVARLKELNPDLEVKEAWRVSENGQIHALGVK